MEPVHEKGESQEIEETPDQTPKRPRVDEDVDRCRVELKPRARGSSEAPDDTIIAKLTEEQVESLSEQFAEEARRIERARAHELARYQEMREPSETIGSASSARDESQHETRQERRMKARAAKKGWQHASPELQSQRQAFADVHGIDALEVDLDVLRMKQWKNSSLLRSEARRRL